MIGRDEWDAGAPRRDKCTPRGSPASCMNDRNAFAPYNVSELPGVRQENERVLRGQRQGICSPPAATIGSTNGPPSEATRRDVRF